MSAQKIEGLSSAINFEEGDYFKTTDGKKITPGTIDARIKEFHDDNLIEVQATIQKPDSKAEEVHWEVNVPGGTLESFIGTVVKNRKKQ